MRKVFLFLMVILFCGCEGAAYLDITVKNNSDISIYVNGDATDTARASSDTEPHRSGMTLIQPGETVVVMFHGPFYGGTSYPKLTFIQAHFFDADAFDIVAQDDSFDDSLNEEEGRYSDERFYLGYNVYSIGELNSLNNTIEYPFDESPKVGFGFL